MIEEIKKYLFEQQKKNEELLKKVKKEDEKENQLLIGAIIATNKIIIDICDIIECYLFGSSGDPIQIERTKNIKKMKFKLKKDIDKKNKSIKKIKKRHKKIREYLGMS